MGPTVLGWPTCRIRVFRATEAGSNDMAGARLLELIENQISLRDATAV